MEHFLTNGKQNLRLTLLKYFKKVSGDYANELLLWANTYNAKQETVLGLAWQAVKYIGRVFHCVGKCPILVQLYNNDMEGKNILLIKI